MNHFLFLALLLGQIQPASVTTLPPGGTVPAGSTVIVLPAPADPHQITTQGAVVGSQTDSAPAFQKTIDTSQGTATIVLPQSPTAYYLASPIYCDWNGLTIRGDGKYSTSLRGNNGGGYTGPMFAVGIKRETAATSKLRRPPNTLVDASAPGRTAYATLGTGTFVVTGQPMQLGYQGSPWQGSPVDYYTGTQYTFESIVSFPTWPLTRSNVFGCSNSSGEPAPFSAVANVAVGEIDFLIKLVGQPVGSYTLASLPPTGATTVATCFQVNTTKGKIEAWCNGVNTPVTITAVGPGTAFGPGCQIAPHNGVWPLTVGSQYGPVPSPATALPVGAVTNEVVGGLNITKGLKYVSGAATQVALDGSGVSDSYRYFTTLNTANVGTIGYLDMTDAPATHGVVRGIGGANVGFWIPTVRPQSATTGTTLEDMTVASAGGASVLIGEALDVTMKNLVIGGMGGSSTGLQGLGTLGGGGSYPISVSKSTLYGGDAAIVGMSQILDASELVIAGMGRDAIRFYGGDTSWDRIKFFAYSANLETYYRFEPGEYGQTHKVTKQSFDNEGWVPNRAFIECEQGANCPTFLTVEHVVVSQAVNGAGAAVPLVHLLGPGPSPTFPLAAFKGGGFSSFGLVPTAVQVDGTGWSGTFATLGLPGAKIVGAGVTAEPGVVVPAPPVPVTPVAP